MMSRKYKHQVEYCENTNPMPMRGGNSHMKSSFNFSPQIMPLSQQSSSLMRLPRKGQNLLPAIAMLPREHSQSIIKNLPHEQQRFVDKLKFERQEIPLSDVARPNFTYKTGDNKRFNAMKVPLQSKMYRSGRKSDSRLGKSSNNSALQFRTSIDAKSKLYMTKGGGVP